MSGMVGTIGSKSRFMTRVGISNTPISPWGNPNELELRAHNAGKQVNQGSLGFSPYYTYTHSRNWRLINNQTAWGDFCILGSTSGTGQASTNRLIIDISGNFAGSGSADISDERLKENITTITDALSKINALTGRKFNWKEGVELDTDTRYGLIAQEVENIIPELVFNKTGIRSIDKTTGEIVPTPDLVMDGSTDENIEFSKSILMTGVIPVLVEAVKELSAKNDALEARVLALENAS